MDGNLTEVDYDQTGDLYDNLVYAVDSVYMWERSTIIDSKSEAMNALTNSFDTFQKEVVAYLTTLNGDVENIWKSVKTLIDCDMDVTEYIRNKMVGMPAHDAYKDDLPGE